MYLVLRPPWAGGGSTVPSDAGTAVAVVTRDAGVPKKKKRPHRGTTPGQPALPTIDSTFDGTDEPEPPPQPQLVQLTGADRASEWRGDAVALPPNKINMNSRAGGAGESRALDDSEIHAGISGGASAVQGCVIAGATNTELKATITLEMIVDGTGRVTKSRVQAPHYLHEHGLLECTRRAIGKMHFPSTGGATLVTLPVTLS